MADHPLHCRFKLMLVQSLGQVYAEQKRLLEALHEMQGIDVFVASYSAMEAKESGEVQSYCVWSEGVDSLLPCTDRIFFFRPSKGEEAMPKSGGWEQVMKS